jgi:hypothetical protein
MGEGAARFISEQGLGPPTYKSQAGSLYWDALNKVVYVNKDGGFTWGTIGGGGGGFTNFLDYQEGTSGDVVLGPSSSTQLAIPNCSFSLNANGDVLVEVQFTWNDNGTGLGGIVHVNVGIYNGVTLILSETMCASTGSVNGTNITVNGHRRFAGLLTNIAYTVKPTIFQDGATNVANFHGNTTYPFILSVKSM